MAAVLGIHLRESKHLAISQFTSYLFADAIQVVHLLLAQGQALLLVIGGQVLDVNDRVRFLVDGEDRLVQAIVDTLQHRVMFGILPFAGEVLLDTTDTLQRHVLGDLHRISTPRSYHFTAGTNKPPRDIFLIDELRTGEKPRELLQVLSAKLLVRINSYIACVRFLEK